MTAPCATPLPVFPSHLDNLQAAYDVLVRVTARARRDLDDEIERQRVAGAPEARDAIIRMLRSLHSGEPQIWRAPLIMARRVMERIGGRRSGPRHREVVRLHHLYVPDRTMDIMLSQLSSKIR